MRGSATTILAAAVGFGVLLPEPVWAVCAPEAASGSGLLVLDLSGCEPAGEGACGRERRGFGVAADPCADDMAGPPARDILVGPGAQAQPLMFAAWSPPVPGETVFGADGDVSPPDARRRASTEAGFGMAASLAAGLGLAGSQMRRRRAMRVVSC